MVTISTLSPDVRSNDASDRVARLVLASHRNPDLRHGRLRRVLHSPNRSSQHLHQDEEGNHAHHQDLHSGKSFKKYVTLDGGVGLRQCHQITHGGGINQSDIFGPFLNNNF